MSRWLVVLAGILALVPHAEARRDRSAGVKAEIEAANREFMARVAKGYGDEVAALYAPDAKLLPPNAPAVTGRAAIAAYWESLIDSGVAELVITTEEVVASKDVATEISSVKVKGKDTTLLDEGKAIVVWRKIDGRWMLWRDIFNSSRGR